MTIFASIRRPRRSASYRLGLICAFLLVCVGELLPLATDLHPYDISDNLRAAPRWLGGSGPTLGTDDLGRDVLSRLVYGARSSIRVGCAVVTASMFSGVLFGLLAGVYGGWIDTFIMRTTDVIMALPSILLAIVLVAILGTGLVTAMGAATAAAVPGFIRVTRSVAALEMKKQYAQAARIGGASTLEILWSEILPNCWVPIVAQATLGFSEAILQVAALGFLGLGARPPIAEWGAMLADARPFIEASPHLIVLPGLCLLITVFVFTCLGSALQQRFDPKAWTRR